MKINKENIKQIALFVLAISLIGLGYLNYNNGELENSEDIIEVSDDYN